MNFNSLQYAIRSQVELKGYNPIDAVIELAPRKGEETLRHEDILEVISMIFKDRCNELEKVLVKN